MNWRQALAPWRRSETLAAHLARTLILWIGGAWLLAALGVTWYVAREIDANFDNELIEVTHRLFPIALEHLDASERDDEPLLFPPPGTFADADLPYRLITPGGRLLALSGPARAVRFDGPFLAGFADNADWRIYTLPHPSRPITLQVADPLQERRDAARGTLATLVLGMLALLPPLAFLLQRIARRELRPLAQLAHAIGQRDGRQLTPITLPALPVLPRELTRVQQHVNRLLERLSLALDVERALAANAAHELRTPLAAARLRLQTALDHGLARTDVEAALTALDTLARRAEKLLQLSRAESSTPLVHEPVDLVHLATTVAQEFWPLADAADRLDLLLPESGAAPAALALGDVDALAIALRNLVENALRYAPGGPVELQAGPGATLTVRDAGPGVPADALPRLLERHARANRSGAGFGLGLSIVQSIVRKHDGTLTLGARDDGLPGLQARITLAPL